MKKINERKLLKAKELALILNVSLSTIRSWVFEKKIPYLKLVGNRSGSVRFLDQDIATWLKNRQQLPNDHFAAIANNIEKTTQKLKGMSSQEDFEFFIKELLEERKNEDI